MNSAIVPNTVQLSQKLFFLPLNQSYNIKEGTFRFNDNVRVSYLL